MSPTTNPTLSGLEVSLGLRDDMRPGPSDRTVRRVWSAITRQLRSCETLHYGKSRDDYDDDDDDDNNNNNNNNCSIHVFETHAITELTVLAFCARSICNTKFAVSFVDFEICIRTVNQKA